jgi:hypothetical protein
MSAWITNPFERFGTYYKENHSGYRRCPCTLEQVKDPNQRAEIVGIEARNGAIPAASGSYSIAS